jgi:hypothetical protein
MREIAGKGWRWALAGAWRGIGGAKMEGRGQIYKRVLCGKCIDISGGKEGKYGGLRRVCVGSWDHVHSLLGRYLPGACIPVVRGRKTQ